MNHYEITINELHERHAEAEKRIAELEAKLADVQRHNTELILRANAAETELARVADLRKRWEALLSAARGLSVVDAASDIDDITNTIEDILSDTPTEEE
jgi:thymidylate kinase